VNEEALIQCGLSRQKQTKCRVSDTLYGVCARARTHTKLKLHHTRKAADLEVNEEIYVGQCVDYDDLYLWDVMPCSLEYRYKGFGTS